LRWGKAEFAADIRALDGQRFLDVLPLTNSVGREELQCTRRQQQAHHRVAQIVAAVARESFSLNGLSRGKLPVYVWP